MRVLGVVGMLENAARYLNADFAERLLVFANDLGEVAGNRHRMREAYVLGRRMAGG
ncbi:MAG: hypothetical protein ACYC3S_07845 [Chloroflexota bacterium]